LSAQHELYSASATPALLKRRGSRRWKTFKKSLPLFTLAMPGIIFKLIFSYIPLLGLIIAFKKYRYDEGIFGSEWVGLRNFRFLFSSNDAWIITRNTVGYNIIFILLTMFCSFTLAILLAELGRRMLKVYQVIMALPYFVSWVVVGYMVLAFLDQQNGFLNQVLLGMGLDKVKWYQEPGYWPAILAFTHLWKSIGFSTLIYFAGILGLDPAYYEAARMDGASRVQMAAKITLPLMTPLMIILLIVDLGRIFRSDFGMFFFIPNDSPFLISVTEVIDTYIYRSMRVVGDVGMSTAAGLFQSVVGFITVVSANAVIRKINRDNSLW
jgi:putative aldouronate transport system permease protein